MAMTAKNVTNNGIFNTCLMITASGMLTPKFRLQIPGPVRHEPPAQGLISMNHQNFYKSWECNGDCAYRGTTVNPT